MKVVVEKNMIDAMIEIADYARQWWYRCRRPRNLEEALKQVLPPRLVEAVAAEVDTPDLIEQLALRSYYEVETLLEMVAERLSLGFTTELHAPTAVLIEQASLAIAELQSVLAIPQNSEVARFLLIVSNPDMIDQAAFQELGIPIVLSTGSLIAEAWKKYEWSKGQFAPQVSEGQVFSVLKQLAEDAALCGASEAFLGHPQAERYEFFAQGRVYSGKIHPAIYPLLLDKFQHTLKIAKSYNDGLLASIRVTVTRNFERPVFCLTWTGETTPDLVSRTSSPPEVISSQAPSPTPSLTSETPDARPRCVLVVDDDSRFLSILTKILEGKGWKVWPAENGTEALSFLEEHAASPDLVVTDVHMPEMDGGSLLQKIKLLDFQIPVIVLTSDENHLLEAELALTGADAFVRKQEDPRILLAWCNNLVHRRAHLASPSIALSNGTGAHHV